MNPTKLRTRGNWFGRDMATGQLLANWRRYMAGLVTATRRKVASEGFLSIDLHPRESTAGFDFKMNGQR